MPLANDLLKVAVQLRPAGPGRPSYAVIRRCISTAYYAVFHSLGYEVARPFRKDVQPTARRLLDHGQAREVADLLRKRRQIPWLPGGPACDPHLIEFAEHFIYLQLVRHRADYDLWYTPTKAEATTAIQRAERALGALQEAREQCPDQLQAVCVAMVANSGTRRRMAS
jgi:hypothetical protein